MYETSIDRAARLLATGSSRRRIVAVLVGIAAPALPGSGSHAAAGCKKVNQNCDRNSDCCNNAHCPNKKCRCKRGFTNCNNRCFDLDTHEGHCGQCNFACSPNNICCDGVCVGNQDQNESHCGSCGNACAALLECVGGSCVLPAVGCPDGTDSCGVGGINPCGTGNCRCYRSTEGATVCVDPFTPGAVCGQCIDSADCQSVGPGAVCIRTLGGTCCSDPPQNFCALPCPEPV